MAILYQTTFTTDSTGYSSDIPNIVSNIIQYGEIDEIDYVFSFNDGISAKVVYNNTNYPFEYGNYIDNQNYYFSFGPDDTIFFDAYAVQNSSEGYSYENASFEIIIEDSTPSGEGFLSKTGLEYLWTKLKAYFQDKLVSGTNIKTINNTSLLGSGNINIQGGSSYVFVATYGVTTYQELYNAMTSGKAILYRQTNGVKTYPITSCVYLDTLNQIRFIVMNNELGGMQYTVSNTNEWSMSPTNRLQIQLISGTSIKTINNESLLGSGDISISSVTVDDTISDTSTNPVQNKAIKLYIDEREPSIEVQGDWHYRIYNDGSFEAWYGKDKVSITINNASGTLYRSNLMNLVLPTNLTNQGTTEIVSYSIGAGHNNYPVWASVASKTATQINYYVLSGGSRNTSPNYMLNAYVYGLITLV